MYLVDYHTHPYSHGEINNYNKRLYKDYIKQAENKGIREMGFSDHEEFEEYVDFEIIEQLKEESHVRILSGLEMDYIPGKEKIIKDKIKKYRLDYSIGSVHFIDDWGFDHPDYIDEYQNRDINQLYLDYFSLVHKAVNSGLFNIIGHFDLIKVFGYKSNLDILEIVKPILKDIKENNLAIEINTNGLNKPVKEIYPSMKIIELAFQLKIPLTFGSDAHRPDRVGENIRRYTEIIKDIGYREIAVFRNRKIEYKKI